MFNIICSQGENQKIYNFLHVFYLVLYWYEKVENPFYILLVLVCLQYFFVFIAKKAVFMAQTNC